MPDLSTDFIRQNAWANHMLMGACRDLTDEQLETTMDGVFGSIRETFRHIVSSELWYAKELGSDRGLWDDEEPWPGWDRLDEMVDIAAEGLFEAAAKPSDRVIRSAGGDWEFEAAIIIVQAVHHGADHRSQICSLLTSLGIEPPNWSAWRWGSDTGRMNKVE